MAQVYARRTSHTVHAHGMQREKEFINTLEDCVTKWGAPDRLLTDSANVENSSRVQQFLRALFIGRWFSEPYKQFQNPLERSIQQLKQRVNVI